MGRPNKWQECLPEMLRLYTEEKLSCAAIGKILGCDGNTVSKNLKAAGIVLESRIGNPNAGRTEEEQLRINAKVSESRKGKGTGHRNGKTLLCEWCSIEYPAHSRGARFCSGACRAKSQSAKVREGSQNAYAENPVRCSCGQALPYESRHTVKYCSAECRKLYVVNGMQKNPDNYKTFNCLNCGEEVTRYKGYGYGKYCSNQCSIRHTKTKNHVMVRDNDVLLDSSYEAFFWGACMIAKIPIERFDRQYVVRWTSKDGSIGGQYGPDFWLPSLGIAVELKGFQDSDDVYKWMAFRETAPLVILDRKALSTITIFTLERELKALVLS